jgi:hypothetical protein
MIGNTFLQFQKKYKEATLRDAMQGKFLDAEKEIQLAMVHAKERLDEMKGGVEEFGKDAAELRRKIVHLRAASGRDAMKAEIKDAMDEEMELMKERRAYAIHLRKSSGRATMKADIADAMTNLKDALNPLGLFHHRSGETDELEGEAVTTEVKVTSVADYDHIIKHHEHVLKKWLQNQKFDVVKLPHGYTDITATTVRFTISGKSGVGVTDGDKADIEGFVTPKQEHWSWHDIELVMGYEKVEDGHDDVRDLNKYAKQALEQRGGSIEMVIIKKHDAHHTRFYFACDEPKKVIAAFRAWKVNARLQTGGIPKEAPSIGGLCDKMEMCMMLVQRIPEELCEVVNWPSILYMTFGEGGIQICDAECGSVICWITYSALTDCDADRGDEEDNCDTLVLYIDIEGLEKTALLEFKIAPLFIKAIKIARKALAIKEEEELEPEDGGEDEDEGDDEDEDEHHHRRHAGRGAPGAGRHHHHKEDEEEEEEATDSEAESEAEESDDESDNQRILV